MGAICCSHLVIVRHHLFFLCFHILFIPLMFQYPFMKSILYRACFNPSCIAVFGQNMFQLGSYYFKIGY